MPDARERDPTSRTRGHANTPIALGLTLSRVAQSNKNG